MNRNNIGCLICRIRRKRCSLVTEDGSREGPCAACLSHNIECWREPFRPAWMQDPVRLGIFKSRLRSWIANRANRRHDIQPLPTISGRFHEAPVQMDEFPPQFLTPPHHGYPSPQHIQSYQDYVPSSIPLPSSPTDSFTTRSFNSTAIAPHINSFSDINSSHWPATDSWASGSMLRSPHQGSTMETFSQYPDIVPAPEHFQGYADVPGSSLSGLIDPNTNILSYHSVNPQSIYSAPLPIMSSFHQTLGSDDYLFNEFGSPFFPPTFSEFFSSSSFDGADNEGRYDGSM